MFSLLLLLGSACTAHRARVPAQGQFDVGAPQLALPAGTEQVRLESPAYQVDFDGFQQAVLQLAPLTHPGSTIEVHQYQGMAEVFLFARVVSTVQNPQKELTLADAKALAPEAILDDEIGVRLSLDPFIEHGLLQHPTWLTKKR